MSKLTAADRRKIPAAKFAGPKIDGKPSFPLTDKKHDRAAISGATRSEHAGNISPSKEAEIKAEARRKLGKTGSTFSAARDKQRGG